MKHKNLVVLALGLVLVLAMSACGGKKNNTAADSTVSPAPTAETTVIPTAEPTPGSVTENDMNTGDVTNPDNSVAPGDHNGSGLDGTTENGSTTDSDNVTQNGMNSDGSDHQGSTVDEDLKRAGEDLGDAARDTANSVEDSVNNMGR